MVRGLFQRGSCIFLCFISYTLTHHVVPPGNMSGETTRWIYNLAEMPECLHLLPASPPQSLFCRNERNLRESARGKWVIKSGHVLGRSRTGRLCVAQAHLEPITGLILATRSHSCLPATFQWKKQWCHRCFIYCINRGASIKALLQNEARTENPVPSEKHVDATSEATANKFESEETTAARIWTLQMKESTHTLNQTEKKTHGNIVNDGNDFSLELCVM